MDAETGLPLAGAEIKYSRGDYSDRSKSDRNGEFAVGPLKQWHYLGYIGSPGSVPFPDWLNYFLTAGSLDIQADGFETRRITIVFSNERPASGEVEPEVGTHDFHGNPIIYYEPDLKMVIRMQPVTPPAGEGQ